MKIVFLSDIHGLTDNFIKIQPIIDGCQKIFVLGDSFNASPSRIRGNYNPDYLIDYFNKNKDKIIYIEGNCDQQFELDKLKFEVHHQYQFEIDGYKINLIHSPNGFHKLNDNEILIFGHTHIPEISKMHNSLYINPGSVSLPRNEKASYLIYENKTFYIKSIDGETIYKK